MTALPEVDIVGAAPEIAGIYADIASLSGIPHPALIWRHLATYSGALPAVWAALRPLYQAGYAQDAAWKTVEAVLVGDAAGPAVLQLVAGGLPGDAIAAYSRVLAVYNRANPVNFVGVRILQSVLSGQGPATPRPLPPRSWIPPTAISGLVPMVAVADIPADVRELIDGLAVADRVDRSAIVPSLYRHLVPWPTLLRLVHADLAPRIASGAIGELLDDVTAALQAEVDNLAAHVGPIPALAANRGVTGALESFSHLIPEMIVIGTLLAHGLDRN